VLEFAYPWTLLLLPLPLLALWLIPPHRETVSALRVPFFDDIVAETGASASAGSVILRRQWVQMLVAGCVWVLLVTALAKPQWVGEPIVRTEAARDIMLAIDLSGSMGYRDFKGDEGEAVSRFEAVQRVVTDFIAGRDTDRIGLIVFGDKAYIQLPFTRDLRTAATLVELMDVAMAGPQTALGDSIGLAIHAFDESTVDDRILILLTDGNDTASRMTPINAAEVARTRGVEIYTIGIGDAQATGEDRVDFDLLADIAERTGGQFFRAEDESALAGVYRRIDEAAVADVRTQSWRPRTSLVHWPAAAALLLLMLTYALLLIFARSPRRIG